MDNLENEIWRDAIGYEGLYLISSVGRVRSLYKEVAYRNQKSPRIFPEKIITPILSRKGYATINMRNRAGSQTPVKIHRLVAIAFIPNPDNKPQVNHKNGIKTDNRVENLEWATNQENVIHSYKTGLQVPLKGGERWQSRLVLNTQTGIFYDCIQEAADTIGRGFANYISLYKKLTGYSKNNTSFILA
jgi:hypothetical protein